MFVYAVVNLRNTWFTGAELTNNTKQTKKRGKYHAFFISSVLLN